MGHTSSSALSVFSLVKYSVTVACIHVEFSMGKLCTMLSPMLELERRCAKRDQIRSRGECLCGVCSRFIGCFIDEVFESKDIRQQLAFVGLVNGHAAGLVNLNAKGRDVRPEGLILE